MKHLPWYAAVVGIMIFLAFAWFCYDLIEQATTIDNDANRYKWDRLLLMFNAVQGMAAAAVGALLGTTVQQARVETAEQRAASNAQSAAKVAAARELIDGLQPPGGAPDSGIDALRRILR